MHSCHVIQGVNDHVPRAVHLGLDHEKGMLKARSDQGPINKIFKLSVCTMCTRYIASKDTVRVTIV